MKRLIIKHLGPVTSIDIELNKVNLIIGPQSSGKSTINKVACFCSWLEKEISIRQETDFVDNEKVFEYNLITFHKLEGFVCEETYIHYESEVMTFSFNKEGKEFQFNWKNRWAYKRCKTAYIPAERNIVATIPNWFDIKMSYNSIRSFMSAWEEARNCFQEDKEIEILNLGVNYFYNRSQKSDWVKINEDNALKFTYTSSGLQSLIPLYVVLQHITKELFTKKQDEDSVGNQTLLEGLKKHIYKEISKEIAETTYALYANIQSTNIYMEEPEENLFATTQRDLIYSLIQTVTSDREHNLFITTHSPYILYALNNCMMADKVKNKIDKQLVEQLPCMNARIDASQVSLWQMQENGQLHSIKKADTQTLGTHYFNDAMNEILNEYYTMMNFA